MTTTPLTDQQLAEIRARADAATPGPWNIARDAGHSEEYGENFVANWTGPYMLGVGDISLGVGQEAEADLAFVLAARTDVPALLAELDRLRAELEQARQQTADRITDGLTAIHDDPDTIERHRPGLRKALRNIHRLAEQPTA